MRAVIQRVQNAEVRVEGMIKGKINKGLLVYVGVGRDDSLNDIEYMAEKVSGLRIFEDDAEKMNLSVKDIGGSILAVSQFTLYGDVRKGKRPSFTESAEPETGNNFYSLFVSKLKDIGIHVETGIFGAHMEVDYINDGPVTILLDSKKLF
jgi:D-tyrosyl-tRNA(Tyr) deacylase